MYNTRQKELILNTIKKQKKEFMIKDIYDSLENNVGLTTIYRLVDRLVDDNVLTKTIGNDNTTYYQYLGECENENHFYLKCEKCGNLIHIDCDCINGLISHISKNHNFKVNNKQIMINGICKKCLKDVKIC